MKRKTYISADEAARELGVNRATLYTYVSRGLIRSRSSESSRRDRLYAAADVRSLIERRELRRDPGKAITKALFQGGAPVLRTSITFVHNGNLYYRGVCAARLARDAAVEDVAALLWLGDRSAVPALFPCTSRPVSRTPQVFPWGEYGIPVMQSVVNTLIRERRAWDSRPEAIAELGATLIVRLVGSVTGAKEPHLSLAGQLQRSLVPDRPEMTRLINTALIMSADDGMDTTTFAVRCIASSRVHPLAAVGAALSAVSGEQFDAEIAQVESLLGSLRDGHAKERVLAQLRERRGVPGFGRGVFHYEDNRGRLLYEEVVEVCGDKPELADVRELAAVAQRHTGRTPNLSFALLALERAAGLPAGAGLSVWLIGRCIGWIAHVIEQTGDQRTIRPSAEYVGARPGNDP